MKRRHQQPRHPIIVFLWENNCIFDTSLSLSLVVLSLMEYTICKKKKKKVILGILIHVFKKKKNPLHF